MKLWRMRELSKPKRNRLSALAEIFNRFFINITKSLDITGIPSDSFIKEEWMWASDVSIGYTDKLILCLDNSKGSSKLDIPVKSICYEFEAASFSDVLDKGILPN